MQSIFQYLNAPDGLVVLIFTLSITFVLAFFLPGQKIGPISIPTFDRGKRLVSLALGCLLFAGGIAASVPLLDAGSGNAASQTAPHAPPIRINSRYDTWNEQTMQIRLAPGDSKDLKASDLYARIAGAPASSCAGLGAVPYTWRVRDPYPRGGEIEVRTTLRGGRTEQVGLGAFGDLVMDYCAIHTLTNVDTEPLIVEIRYASAALKN